MPKPAPMVDLSTPAKRAALPRTPKIHRYTMRHHPEAIRLEYVKAENRFYMSWRFAEFSMPTYAGPFHIGYADDKGVPGSVNTISYQKAHDAAMAMAMEKVEERRNELQGLDLTVETLVRAYIEEKNAVEATRRDRSGVRSDSDQRLTLHVLGREAVGNRPEVAPAPIASRQLMKLSASDIQKWKRDLKAHDESKDLSTATRQRIVASFRAALNSIDDHPDWYEKVKGTNYLETIKEGFKKNKLDRARAIEAANAGDIGRENQQLDESQIRKVIEAAQEIDQADGWNGDLLALVMVLAQTGARYSQLTRMQVRHALQDEGMLNIPHSRKGSTDDAGTGSELVPVDPEVFKLLKLNRPKDALLFTRHSKVKKGNHWVRKPEAGAWQKTDFHRLWVKIRDRAGLPEHIVSYALRHSSIIRQLTLKELDHYEVALMHNTSVVMMEKSYGRWMTRGYAERARATTRSLMPKPNEDNVTPISDALKRV